MSRLISEWKAKQIEEAAALHDRVVEALRSGRADLVSDARMLDHNGSPVHSPWDHLIPLLALMLLAMVVLLSAGMAFGVVAMFAGATVHILFNRHYVAWRIQERTLLYATHSLPYWQALWDHGGVALVVRGSGEMPCYAPTGDWRKFVRRLFPVDGDPLDTPAPPPPPPPPKQKAKPAPLPEPEPFVAPEEDEAQPVIEHAPAAKPAPPPPPAEPEPPPPFPGGRLELEG